MKQWAEYLDEYGIPESRVAMLSGTQSVKAKMLTEDYDWLIISYNLLGQTSPKNKSAEVYAPLLKRKFVQVMFDEAHRMRNRHAQWTKQAHKLKTNGRWMLTGSPIYRNAGDVWSLLNLCSRKLHSSYWRYVEQHCTVEQSMYSTEVVGVQDPKAFRSMLNNHMLRRTYKDVGAELPPMMRPITIRAKLTPATYKQYRDLEIEAGINQAKGQFIREQQAMIPKLRALCSLDENKITAVKDLIEDINDRVIILTWYKAVAARVSKALGIAPPITGDIPPNKRTKALKDQSKHDRSVVVATIESIKEGLNLQEFSHVVFYEEDWQPGTNNQILARFHRTGQDRRVQVYYIRAEGTIEEAVHGVHKKKDNITNTIMEA